MTDFSTLGLSPEMLRALEHANHKAATPIQTEAIPLLMTGRDLIGIAQTGSGKTAAFVVPLLEKLAVAEGRAEPHFPRALILAPTRELAIQTTDRLKELAVGMRASVCTIFGGTPYRTQTHILRRGVDVLVATPGRLLDHMKRGNLHLDAVDYFVLDEADRMLDLGFVDDVRTIKKRIRGQHQSVMFSATMSDAIEDLKHALLNDPATVSVAPSATVADNLEHGVLHVPGHLKRELLAWLIEQEEPARSIVFVRTRKDAEEIREYLESLGLKADAIHGDKAQKLRQRTINGFRDGQFGFLVATDVAARGIDVAGITHVFNFDVPVEAESYIHRIGRTARGGASGRAFTLMGKNEPRLIRAIEDILGEPIEVIHDHPYRLVAKKKATIGAKKRPSVAARKAKQKAAPKKAKGKRAELYGDAPKKSGPGKSGPKKPSKNKGKPKRDGDTGPARGARAGKPGKPGKPGRSTSGARANKPGRPGGNRPRKPGGNKGGPKGGGNAPLKRR